MKLSIKILAGGMLLTMVISMLLPACKNNDVKKEPVQWPSSIAAPVAAKKEKILTAHGDTRIDEYYWMNDYFKKGPDSTLVVEYLKAENAYLDTMLSPVKALRESLFEEMKARIQEKDESVPVFNNGYYYYTRTEEGKQYYKYCRKKGSLEAPEEILLDVDKMAEGHGYYDITGFNVSPDNKLLAYGEDLLSRRQYTIRIKNLETGQLLPESIPNTEGYAIWAADNKTFFYTTKNPVTLLSEKIMRHQLGSSVNGDAVVYTEKDPSNYIGVFKTKSQEYICIISSATLSSEYRILNANDPLGSFKIFQPRINKVLYYIDHWNDRFLIRTNKDAENFRLLETPLDKTGVENWKEVIAHRPDVLLEEVEVFKDHWAIVERKEGLLQLRIRDLKTNSDHYLEFGEPSYSAYVSNNPEYNSSILRYNYTSLTTPNSVFDYDLNSRSKKLMKEQIVLGGFKKEGYITERIYATAADGVKVPISLVYKKGTPKDGSAPPATLCLWIVWG